MVPTKRLVDEETYRRDFPERPGPDRDIEEALKDDVLNVVYLCDMDHIIMNLTVCFPELLKTRL